MRIFKWSKTNKTHTHRGKVSIITYQEKLQMKARTHTTAQLLRMNDVVLKKMDNLKYCTVVKLIQYMACGRSVRSVYQKHPLGISPQIHRELIPRGRPQTTESACPTKAQECSSWIFVWAPNFLCMRAQSCPTLRPHGLWTPEWIDPNVHQYSGLKKKNLHFIFTIYYQWIITQVALAVKEPAGQCKKTQEMWVLSLGWDDPLEEGKATYSTFLAWRIPWTKESGWGVGGLQSRGSHRVGHDWSDLAQPS